MRGVVLADTGPLYAGVDPGDSLHQRALEDQRHINRENFNVAASYATLQEAHDLVLRKLGRVRARNFLRELVTITIFLTPTTQDYEKAVERTLRYPDQNITLADAIVAGISDRLDIPVWTFDHHFDVMRVRVWRDT